jgi:hypothetical protein
MNMLTGESFGVPSSQVFYSGNVEAVGLTAPKAIFAGGETGRTNGEWKMVNRPMNLFGMTINNPVLEWVETPAAGFATMGSGVAMGSGFGSMDGGVAMSSGGAVVGVARLAKTAMTKKSEEGVLIPGSIQQLGTGNVFNRSCPPGSTSIGATSEGETCKYPDEWETCGEGEMDTGIFCQVPMRFENGNMTGGNVRAKQFKVGKVFTA